MTIPKETPVSDLLTAARAWHDAGYAVIPCHEDGGKRPFGQWKQYQSQRPTWADVEGWLGSGRYTGIGVLTGAASGNVEMLEIEGPMDDAVARLGRVVARAAQWQQIGIPDLLADIARGCVEQSAGGGLHLFIRVSDGPALGNTKLARTAEGKVVSETRGEGGFVVVAPTPGRNGHEPGASYMFINGGHPSRTVAVTSEDRDILHLLFASALEEYIEPEVAPTATSGSTHDGLSAFDDYRQRVTWRDILAPAGWREGPTMADGRTHWTRPGGQGFEGTSATTVEDGPMFVFSTSVAMPQEVGLSKGQVFAHLHHGGDMSAAARELTAAGFGSGLTYADLPAWDAPPPGIAPTVDEDGEAVEPTPYEAAVGRKYAELRVMEDARGMLAALKAGQAPPLTGLSLADFLAEPDEEARYRVTDMWPAEGRIMLAAAAKSGKTTMVAANLVPSLVDGRPFLGRYSVEPVAGRVALLNMEVGDGTMRRWMRDCRIEAPEKVVVANLRGKASALALASDAGRKRFAEFLKRHEAEVVILDPLAPVLASLGLDENSNADVSTFYSWWAEALTIAGIVDDVIVHHTGHAGQRSRGASRLLDEPDAIWTLTREDEEDGEFASLTPVRYLAAYGRDVELGAESLEFHPATRGLELTGMGRAAVKGSKNQQAVLDVFTDGRARTTNGIVNESGIHRNTAWELVKQMVADGVLENAGKSSNGRPMYLPTTLIEEA